MVFFPFLRSFCFLCLLLKTCNLSACGCRLLVGFVSKPILGTGWVLLLVAIHFVAHAGQVCFCCLWI